MGPSACSKGTSRSPQSWGFHGIPHFRVGASDVGDLTKGRQETGIRAQVPRNKTHNHNCTRLPGWPQALDAELSSGVPSSLSSE